MKSIATGSRLICLFSICSCLLSCREKTSERGESFFPVLSFLNSQVAMVDTSLYPILKLTPRDSAGADTTYIHREQFRSVSSEFLAIPDISAEKFRDRYRESKQFDQGLNLVILTYEAIKPAEELLQSEQVTIQPGIGGDKVKNIIINTYSHSKDSSVQKRMLWNADESFQVSTIKQFPGQPETTSSYKVTWNEHEY
ncbi:MAG: hypothetical protein ABWZ25_14775 [Chitinophagaceae bacterium]